MTLPSFNVWAVVLAAGVLSSGGQPPQGKGDPQSSFEPRSNPGAGQQFLKKLRQLSRKPWLRNQRNGMPVQENSHKLYALLLYALLLPQHMSPHLDM